MFILNAFEKAKKGDHYGAISDYTKAIEINPDKQMHITIVEFRNLCQSYYGAISDYSKAIEINPNKANAYYNRGTLKVENSMIIKEVCWI